MHLVDLSAGTEALQVHDPDAGASAADGPDALEELEQIEGELEAFDPGLLERPRLLIGSKLDSALEDRRTELQRAAAERGLSYHEISAATHDGLKALEHDIRQVLARAKAELEDP